MVSIIQSNFRGMGSGLVADGLGFMFQDRGELFSLQDGHPNIYAPGKRPFQTIIPASPPETACPGLRSASWVVICSRKARRRSSSTEWTTGSTCRPPATARAGTMKAPRRPWEKISPTLRRVAFFASKPRSCRYSQGPRRDGLAHGRERRRLRPLRVH